MLGSGPYETRHAALLNAVASDLKPQTVPAGIQTLHPAALVAAMTGLRAGHTRRHRAANGGGGTSDH